MSLEEDFNSKPLPQEATPAEKKWPIDVEKLSPAERDEIVERINALKTREKEETDLNAQLEAKIARNDRFIDNNIAIERMTSNLDAQPEPTLAAAAGGGMVPPTEPQEVELVPKAAIDAMTGQVKKEREDGARLSRMIAENKETAEANELVETVRNAAAAPNIAPVIPPQTRDPSKEDPAIVEMRGVGSNWADAGVLAAKIGTAAYEKTAEWLPHSAFGRLVGRAERLGMRLRNLPQEAAYGVMYRWRSEHAAAAEMDRKKYQDVVKEKTAALTAADAGRAATVEAQRAAGLPTADIAMKLEGERKGALREVEEAQRLMDKAGKRLEDLNARKSGWAKKENDLAERTMAKIDQRLAPEKATLDTLAVKKGEINTKLESLKRARDMGHQGLQELEAKLKLDPSLINNVAIPDKIAAVKELLGRIDNEYNQHTKAVNGIDNKMRKANNYISDWMGYRNEEARVSTQDRRTSNNLGDQNIEESQPHEAPNLTHAPEPKTPERGHVIPAKETISSTTATGIEGTVESKESLKEATPEAYIEQWNKVVGKNGATFPDLKAFTEYAKLKPKEIVPIEKIETALTELLTKDAKGGALYYAKIGIAQDCKKVRDTLIQKKATV
jgi:hypothetical protein